MSGTYIRNEDGSFSEAVPLGWQGHGIDWELYRRNEAGRARKGTHHVANGYDEDVLIGSVRARTLWGLNRKMRRVEKTHDLPRNGVL